MVCFSSATDPPTRVTPFICLDQVQVAYHGGPRPVASREALESQRKTGNCTVTSPDGSKVCMGVEGTEEHSSIGFVFYRSMQPETSPSVENTGHHLGVGGMDREAGGTGDGAPPNPSLLRRS